MEKIQLLRSTLKTNEFVNKLKINKKIIAIIIACVCACIFIGFHFYIRSLAYGVCHVEAGVSVTPQDFLKKQDPQAFFTDKSDVIDINVPGEYHVYIKSGLFTHKCLLYIEDTIAPQAETVPVQIGYNETCEAGAFVTNIQDATQVKAAFKEQPNFSKVGIQTVTIVLSDLSNNETVLESQLHIVPVKTELVWEAGSDYPSADDFVLTGKEKIMLTEDINITTPSKQDVEIQVDGVVYKSILNIVDTVAPVVEVQDLSAFAKQPLSPEDFVVSIEDATQVTVEFADEIDTSQIGEQSVKLRFTDEGKNTVTADATLTLKEDTQNPEIIGARDISHIIGDTISYRKNVTVKDNCEQGLQLLIDDSKVNLDAEGVYPLTYKAVDASGNTSSVTVQVTVKKRAYSLDEVYSYADKVLASIITNDMSGYDKLRAIFNYVKGHVSYIDNSDESNWVKGAYEGLVLRKGDCFVFASTARALLTRAGIQNIQVAKIPDTVTHFWNIVDIGEGWYHFDTCPRRDHTSIFYWTDAQLMDYSARNNNSHNYDHSAYPKVN